MSEKPKTAILLSVTNVLFRFRPDRGRRAFHALVRSQKPLEESRIFLSDRALAFQASQLSPEQFLLGLLQSLGGADVTYDELCVAWCDVLDTCPEMEALLSSVLENHHGVYLLGNMDPLLFDEMENRIPLVKRASGVHLSFEARKTLPDRTYLRQALERFSLRPASAIFIDANEEHVEAAKEEGIPSCLFQGDISALRSFLVRWGVNC